jgi:hypothetical protein
MILGSDKAKVGHGALGETFRSTAFPVEIAGKIYSLHDTVGLGEYSGGTVDSAKAVRNLYRLVTDLSNSGGVNLLVFVIKCGRLTENMHKNYGLFHHVFCDSRVPIVIIITGCENVEPAMDTWWINNESSFTKAGMSFNDHACVCAFRGTKASGYCNMYLVEESVDVVKRLIVENCMPNGWEKVCHPNLSHESRGLTIYRNTFNLATNCLASKGYRFHDRPVSVIVGYLHRRL